MEENRVTYVENQKDMEGKPKIKEKILIKKHIQPDTFAIQFVLTNKAPSEYKNRVNNEVTGKDGKELSFVNFLMSTNVVEDKAKEQGQSGEGNEDG